MSIIGSTIKGVSKVVAVVGKLIILSIGKTIYIITKPSDKDVIGEANYEKLAKVFENIITGTGDFTGNLIDNILNLFLTGTTVSKFKSIHGEMEDVFTKEKDSYIKQCKAGEVLRLEHEKFSLYKPNSIAVYKGFQHLGYLNEESCKILIPLFNEGCNFKGKVEKVIKGKKGKGYNLKILITMSTEPIKNN